MKLVFSDGMYVTENDLVKCFRGEDHIVCGWTEPRHEGSTGRVYVRDVDASEDDQGQGYFPSVFDMKFISDEEAKRYALANDDFALAHHMMQ